MRWLLGCIMAAGLALMAGGANAQAGEFAGGFAFQTSDLEAGPEFEILSGYAITEQLNNGTYRVSLLATDYQQNDQNWSRVYALQLCTGQPSGDDMVITCQVINHTGQNYLPDNFTIRQDAANRSLWRGTMSSSSTAPVEFIDLD